MKIFINARCFDKPLTGVQRYLQCVSAGLDQIDIQPEFIKPKPCFSSGLLGYFWEQFVLPFKIKNHGLLWSPANLGPIFYSNQVVTIHDIAWFDHPEWFKKQYVKIYRFIIPLLLKRVRLILTVSEYSKQRIMDVFGVPENKIQVTGLFLDPSFCPGSDAKIALILKKHALNKPYVLCVASLEPRKNIQRLLEAWGNLKSFHPSYDLVVIGSAGNVFKNTGLTKASEGAIFLGRVADEDLPDLYSGASVFAYPSLYEGFGLPILEAMTCGVPVLSSNKTSIPEVAGNAAYLVDPYSIEEITNGLSNLLSDKALRDSLIQKGFERLAVFSRENGMRKFKEAFENLDE